MVGPGDVSDGESGYRPADSPRAGAHALAVDLSGNVHVAGQAWSDETLGDVVVVKYSSDLPAFVRGDCDGNGRLAITDAISLLMYLYAGEREPPCLSACDSNGDGSPGGFQADAIHILLHLFLAGPAPPRPYPRCGTDPADRLGCRTATRC